MFARWTLNHATVYNPGTGLSGRFDGRQRRSRRAGAQHMARAIIKQAGVKQIPAKRIPAKQIPVAGRKITAAEAQAVPQRVSRPRSSVPGGSTPGGRRGAIDDATIYHSVYTAIVDHIIMPGTKLPEDVLARAFGVSRTRIRKVLLALSHENLVTLQHNRGASVTKPGVQEAREVFAARRIVETGIAAELARHITVSQIATLRRFVAREHAAETARDRSTGIRLSGEFHLELAKLIGNEPLSGFLRALISRTSLIIAVYEAPGKAMCSHAEHGALLDRLAARDVAGAVRYMEEHLQRLEDSLDLAAAKRRPVDLQGVFAQLAVTRR
jgi:DNA-binding GntR family transcriptional regulator